MLRNLNISDIKPADIFALICTGEDLHIDFKLKLASQFENCKDISAMANAAGGDIVVGIKEGVGDKKGLADQVVGIDDGDLETIQQQIASACQTTIEPPMVVTMQPVPVDVGKSVLIIRVGRSYRKPHGVKNPKGGYSFYKRNNLMSAPMDISQIREEFISSEEVPKRLRKFREERVEEIRDSEFGYRIGHGRIIVHAIPRAAFDTSLRLDANALLDMPGVVSPLKNYWVTSLKNNIDGIRGTDTTAVQGVVKLTSHVQIFRNGIFEATDGEYLHWQRSGHNYFELEDVLVKKIGSLFESIDAIMPDLIEPPVYLFLTMTGMKGHHFLDENRGIGSEPVDRDVLNFEEIVLNDGEDDPRQYLRPLFNEICQAFGLREAPRRRANI